MAKKKKEAVKAYSGKVIGHFDGGCYPNPGTGSCGLYIYKDTEDKPELLAEKFYIGPVIGLVSCTNNTAEYVALTTLLLRANNLGIKLDIVRGDSQLIVKQVLGEYAATDITLAIMCKVARYYLGDITLEWVPRKDNAKADALATEARQMKAPRLTLNSQEWWCNVLRHYRK